jgi:ABC-type multidrug transport system fused ATPase/permease subunit
VALAIAAGALVIKLVLGLWAARLTARLAASSLATVRRELLGGFFSAQWALQSQEQAGRLQDLASTSADRVAMMTVSASQALAAALSLLVLVAGALVTSPLAALGVAVAGGLVVLAFRPIIQRTRHLGTVTVATSRAFAVAVAEAVGMVREARAFGVGPDLEEVLEDGIDQAELAFRRSREAMLSTSPVFQTAIMLLLIGALAGIIALAGSTRVAAVGAAVLLLVRSLSYAQQVQSSVQQLAELAPNQTAIESQRAAYEAAPFERGRERLSRLGPIEARDLTFAYLPGIPVLQGLDFRIDPGDAVGVVGPSGGGKSTLVQLLLRLRHPVEGSLSCDGVELVDVEAGSWARLIGFVPQDPSFLHATIAENIRFFRNIEDRMVRLAARAAHIEAEILQLPDGFDTVMGAEGVALSGGQRQRLALARALAGRPQLLVLDEPTSALDAASEARIHETLEALRGTVTLVVIAHRHSTIEICDRLMVLRDGVIEAIGSPQELARTTGFYAESVRLAGHSEGGA